MCSGTTSPGSSTSPSGNSGKRSIVSPIRRQPSVGGVTSILWFRRDLRIHDHPALRAAGPDVVPVFCLDDGLLHGRHSSGPRTQFMLECLRELDASLRRLGSGLVV